MADFFRLNSDTEDKIVNRAQRIYADTLAFQHVTYLPVETSSKSTMLKIKFFLDVINIYDSTTKPVTNKYIKVGKYFELEPKETAQIIYSGGFISLEYDCLHNDAKGVFTLSLSFSDERVTGFFSSIVVEDSFFNYDKAWLNPDNPDNLLDKITEDKWREYKTDMMYNTVSWSTEKFDDFITLYKDDFLEIGFDRTPSSLTMGGLFVIPLNEHAINDKELTKSFVLWNADNAPDTGVFETTTLDLYVDGNRKDRCFICNLNHHGYAEFTCSWLAKDGFYYSVIIKAFVNNGIGDDVAYGSAMVYFLGKNKENTSPVFKPLFE